MNFLQSVFLGLVQGVAEFLPISSSGHLGLIQNLFGIEVPEFYDVLLHFGTLIAVFIYYWQDVCDMVLEFFRGCRALVKPEYREDPLPPARRLVLLVIVATLPLVVVLPVKSRIEALSGSNLFIGIMLLITGSFLFFSDRMPKGKRSEKSASLVSALLVGVAQAIATVPGISRSGATISAGIACGYKRKYAVRFSFLMSLPAVLGATLLSLIDVVKAGVPMGQLPVYLVGVVVAGISGYFCIRLLDSIASKGKFGNFAYYCWAIGVFAIVASFIF